MTPGSYFLLAYWSEDGNKTYTARDPIDVGISDLEGVSLTITQGVEVRGRLRVEGNTELNLSDVQIFLRPPPDMPMGGAVARVRSDGSFVIQNVADGSYRVGVYGMSEDFFLKSGRAGDEDLLDAGLAISRGQSPGSLELVVSSAAGRVDGVVFGEQKQPFSGASVVLVPDPPYRSRTELYKTTTTDQTGGFTLRGIAQGEYKLFAWEEI